MNTYSIKRMGILLAILLAAFIVGGFAGGSFGASRAGTSYGLSANSVLIEALAIIILFVLYIVIRFLLFHMRLRSCKAPDSFQGLVFHFGHNIYQKEKYVNLRRESYLSSSSKHLAKLLQHSFWGEKRNLEYSSAEREALTSALETVKSREEQFG